MDAFKIVRGWRADLLRYSPPDTARVYRHAVFNALVDLPHPEQFTSRDVRRYLDGCKTSVAKNTHQGLSHLTAWMLRKGIRDDDPLAPIERRTSKADLLPRGLEYDELTAVLDVIRRQTPGRDRWIAIRDRRVLMVQAHFLTGPRPGELVRMERKDVHLDGHPRVHIVARKTGGNERVVPLNPDAVEVFRALCEGVTGRLFPITTRSYYDWFHPCAQAAGLEPAKCRPYALRHSFASHLIRSGVDIVMVKQLMGHKNIQTTQRYAQAGDPRLAQAVLNIHLPRADEAVAA